MNFNLGDLRDDDVVSIDGTLMKADKLKDVLKVAIKNKMLAAVTQTFSDNGAGVKFPNHYWNMDSTAQMEYLSNLWCIDGIETEILQVGASKWLEGKIKLKVSVEFEPAVVEADNSEETLVFPLDDIRQTLNGVNSIDG